MSIITMTIQQVVDLGLWFKLCEHKGWDVESLKNGRVNYSDEIALDTKLHKSVDDVPIVKDGMSLFSYNFKCTPSWEGMYFGIVFAKNRQDALEKLNVQYSWEDGLSISLDDITLLDYNQFENDCYEVGSHRE